MRLDLGKYRLLRTSAANVLWSSSRLLSARVSVSLRRMRTSASQSCVLARKMGGTARGNSSLKGAGGADTARMGAGASTGTVGSGNTSVAAVCSEFSSDSSLSTLRLSCRDGKSSMLSLRGPCRQ